MDGLVKTLGTVLLLLAATLWAAVLLLVPAALVKFCWGICLYEVLCLTESIRQTRNKRVPAVYAGCYQYRGSSLRGEEASCRTLYRI